MSLDGASCSDETTRVKVEASSGKVTLKVTLKNVWLALEKGKENIENKEGGGIEMEVKKQENETELNQGHVLQLEK